MKLGQAQFGTHPWTRTQTWSALPGCPVLTIRSLTSIEGALTEYILSFYLSSRCSCSEAGERNRTCRQAASHDSHRVRVRRAGITGPSRCHIDYFIVSGITLSSSWYVPTLMPIQHVHQYHIQFQYPPFSRSLLKQPSQTAVLLFLHSTLWVSRHPSRMTFEPSLESMSTPRRNDNTDNRSTPS